MPLYFAYGSNMDAAAMAGRCPRARLLGRGRLPRWRPFLMASGFLSVAPDPRASVHGVLWDVPAGDVAALDRYEDIAHGLYLKRVMPVLREPIGSARALVYVGADASRGAAERDYLAGVVAAARSRALPEKYVACLEALGGPGELGASPSGFRAIKLESLRG